MIPISPQQPLFAQERLAIPLLLCKCIARVGLEYQLQPVRSHPLAGATWSLRPCEYVLPHCRANSIVKNLLVYCGKTSKPTPNTLWVTAFAIIAFSDEVLLALMAHETKCIARVGLEYRLWAGSQLIPMAIRRSDRRPLFYAHATGNVAIRRFACMSFRAAAQILYCQKTFEGGNFAIPLTGWLLTSNCLRREVSQ